MFQHYYYLIGFFIFNMISTSAHAYFVENKGQVINQFGEVNEEVLFIHQQPGLKVTLTKSGFSYEKSKSNLNKEEISTLILDEYSNPTLEINSYRIDFLSPTESFQIEKFNPLHHKLNYYTMSGAITNVEQFEKVVFKNISSGVDIEFIINNDGLFKYNIIAQDYQSARQFKLSIKGAQDIFIEGNELNIQTPFGLFKDQIPVSYLVSKSKTEEVDVRFVLEHHTIRFEVPEFGSNQKLIIDPQPEGVWGSYFGGAEFDVSTAIAADVQGNIFHCGITLSSNNIATSGSHEASFQGELDGYIAKHDPQGNLIWSSYYGGPQAERTYGLTTDEEGNVYLGGSTYSESGISTIGSYQDVIEGLDDIFVVKFTSEGVREWGTYIGGTDHDFVTALKHDNGKIYIIGHTRSTNGIATPGTFITSYSSNEAGYLMCISDDGTAKNWGTYIGSNYTSSVEGIQLVNNSIILGGRTTATAGISSIGAHQSTMNGFGNGFLQRFDDTGNLIWGTYYGGNYTDKINAVVIDENDYIYAAGDASSQVGISTPGAFQETRLSSEQGFLVKFNLNGERQWGTYVGGTSSDYVSSLAISDTLVVLGGKTLSTNWISTTGAYQETISGGFDGFLLGFNTNGNYIWGTYYGGNQDEDIVDLTFGQSRNLYGTGDVYGSLNGISFGNAHQSSYGGSISDGFVFKFCFSQPITINYNNGYLIADGAEDYEWFLDGNPLGIFTDSIQPISDGTYTVIGSSSGSCEMNSDEYIHNTSSLESYFNETVIYPNPNYSEGILFIESNIPIENIKIFTLQGQEFLFSNVNSSELILELPKMANGLYIVRFFTYNNYFDKKVFIID